MKPLFILQLVCCTVTTLLALQLVFSRLQVRWKSPRYELSRRLLCIAMSLLSVHYLFQMVHGLREDGADVGALFNIIAYTPTAFIITIAILNMETPTARIRRHSAYSVAAYMLILATFALGCLRSHSLHIGSMLYMMLFLFVASMAYFVSISLRAIKRRRHMMTQNEGGDLLPYIRYSYASVIMLYLTAITLPAAILFNTLLIYIGPLMLLTLIFFVSTFISIGYYITPMEEMAADCETAATEEESIGSTAGDAPATGDATSADDRNRLSTEDMERIKAALDSWCDARGYKNCEMNLFALSEQLHITRHELSQYFSQSGQVNFRMWLADVRFNAVLRLMREQPQMTNDAISIDCGFSSRGHLYRVFKSKTGMTPREWRELPPPDAAGLLTQ